MPRVRLLGCLKVSVAARNLGFAGFCSAGLTYPVARLTVSLLLTIGGSALCLAGSRISIAAASFPRAFASPPFKYLRKTTCISTVTQERHVNAGQGCATLTFQWWVHSPHRPGPAMEATGRAGEGVRQRQRQRQRQACQAGREREGEKEEEEATHGGGERTSRL